MPPILILQDTWLNSPLSVARHYGGIRIEGHEYYIEGYDLVRHDFRSLFRKLGRKKFMEILATVPDASASDNTATLKRLMREAANTHHPSPTTQQPSLFD